MWDQKHTFSFPTSISFGPGVIEDLGAYLLKSNCKRPLLVSDSKLVELKFYKKVIRELKSKNISPTVFTRIDANPIKSNVENGKRTYHGSTCDCIIGFGGGASMDVARAIALLANHDRDLFDFDDALDGDVHLSEEIPSLICIPTTSGTGSEVGRSCVISDDHTHEKKVLFSPKLMAKHVFADPELTLELPPHISAATGMDALTHNLEAFVAKGHHPICDGIAKEALFLISESLEKSVNSPSLELRSKMMMASLMGAVAFQKGLGVIHSLSHALSTKFNIHHGLANAVMLVPGVSFNEPVAKLKYQTIANLFGTSDLKEYLRDLKLKIGIHQALGDFGIEESDLHELSTIAFRDNCHKMNPRGCSREDLEQLYRQAL